MMTSSHAQATGALGAEDAAAAGHSVPVPASPSSADVIQREMEHLREMVFALSREVAIERAARDQLQKTVDAWEDREDPGDGAEAEVRKPRWRLTICTSLWFYRW